MYSVIVMIKSAILFPLYATVVLGSQCFSSSSSPEQSYKQCCSGKESGKETLNGVEFEYICGTYPTGGGGPTRNVRSAQECAKLCAADSSCQASGWSYTLQQCWINTDKNFQSGRSSTWLTIVRTDKKPDKTPDDPTSTDKEKCEDKVEAAKKEATDEAKKEARDACDVSTALAVEKAREEALKSCKNKDTPSSSTCDKKVAEAEERALRDAQNDCKKAVNKAVEDAKKTFETDSKQEKEDLEKKLKDAKKDAEDSFRAEKEDLEKKLKDALEKGKNSSGSGGFGPIDPANADLDDKYICPKHDRREFTLPTPDGGSSKWQIFCDHAAVVIDWNHIGHMNATQTPYKELLAMRHWDAGYRAFYWRDTDFEHRHLVVYNQPPATRPIHLENFHIKYNPHGRHHVIARIDDYTLKRF